MFHNSSHFVDTGASIIENCSLFSIRKRVSFIVIIITLLLTMKPALASPEQIRIACSKDLAPFHFLDDSGKPTGITDFRSPDNGNK